MFNKNIYKNIWIEIKNAYKGIRALDISPIKLEEIDVVKKIVTLRSRGARAILKLSLAEAIADPSIVANLISIQASWLGYYAGSIYEPAEIQRQKQFLKNAGSEFLLRCKKQPYRIVSQDRKGKITYINTLNQVSESYHPIEIFQDEQIISCFDSSQACYIGILAGIFTKKQRKTQDHESSQRPILRVVK